MNDQEFSEWLNQYSRLDAAQAETFFRHAAREFKQNADLLLNMNAAAISHCLAAVTEIIKNRTGE